MKKDEIRFNQKRWTKRVKTETPGSTRKHRYQEEEAIHERFFDESLDVSSYRDDHEDLPRPVLPPPPVVMEKKEERNHELAENRKRMTSERKQSPSMFELPIIKDNPDEESYDRTDKDKKEEDNPFLPEILALLKSDPAPAWDESHDTYQFEQDLEESSILTDIIASMEESLDERQGFKEHYKAQKDLEVLDGFDPIMEEKAFGAKDDLKAEICSMLDESSSWEEKIEWSCEEEESLMLESSFYESPDCDEGEESGDCENWEESTSAIASSIEEMVCLHPAVGKTVKVPVLLASREIEVDVMEALKGPPDGCEIIDVQLSVHSQKESIPLPSSFVFLSGVLNANITYNQGGKLQRITQTIPWEKVIELQWKTPPQVSHASRKEYTFTGGLDGDVHYEFAQSFAAPVEAEVSCVRLISHTDWVGDGQMSIQGVAVIHYNFLQNQYVCL